VLGEIGKGKFWVDKTILESEALAGFFHRSAIPARCAFSAGFMRRTK
jgi:hypothetical protein